MLKFNNNSYQVIRDTNKQRIIFDLFEILIIKSLIEVN